MINRMVGIHKITWHLKIFSALWAYKTSVKTTTGFTPFQLIYGLEAVLPIECEIPSLKLTIELFPNTTVEEERFLYLNKIDKSRQDASFTNETHKKRLKAQYDRNVQPRSFEQSDLVLTYDHQYDKLEKGKSESMWHSPYIISKVLEKRGL